MDMRRLCWISNLHVRIDPPARQLAVALLLVVLLASPEAVRGQAAGTRYAVLIGGLGGDPAYTERFSGYLSETRSLLVDRASFDTGNVFVLGEESIAGKDFVDDVSTAENIRNAFESLSARVTPDDHVFVVLFGHGSFDGEHARLNIPRRDLDDADYAAMVDGLSAGRIVFVNTASASGPFAAAVSGSERIVITATATGTERDETVFPRMFIDALSDVDADLDRNGGLSVREAFSYAAQQTARSFEEAGQLATEHPQLDDDGDGAASRLEALDAGGDGHLASVTYIRPRAHLATVSAAARPLLREKETIERAIADLKSRKAQLREDAYYAEMEELFVQLARLNDRMESTP